MSARTTRFRRRDQPRWYGPLGALAVLSALAVGYVAYTANSGLPWQSRYRVTVEVPDALRLVRDADVRNHGVLVGQVLGVEAVPGQGGTPAHARLQLALSRSLGALPADTTAQVRPASTLGLTYVDLQLGSSHRTIPDGGTLPLSQARATVDLPNLLDVFDRRAGDGFQRAVSGAAYGIAGRGVELNAAIAATSRLLPALGDVSAALAAPSTRLASLIGGYDTVIGGLAQVSPALDGLISGAASTLGALAAERSALGAALDLAPVTEAAATLALLDVRPGLEALARVAVALRPAGRLLPTALDALNQALAAGIAPLGELPPAAGALRTALRSLANLSRSPSTSGALRKLLELELPTLQVLSVLTPAQVYCNVLAMWGQYASGAFLGFGTGQGPALGNLVVTGLGARGEMLQSARPASNLAINPLPQENGQACQSGNELWTGRQQLNTVAGLQVTTTRHTVPPAGVRTLAARAGLLAPVEGAR